MKTNLNPREEHKEIMGKRQFRDLLSALLTTAAVMAFVIGLFTGHLNSVRANIAGVLLIIAALVASYKIRTTK